MANENFDSAQFAQEVLDSFSNEKEEAETNRKAKIAQAEALEFQAWKRKKEVEVLSNKADRLRAEAGVPRVARKEAPAFPAEVIVGSVALLTWILSRRNVE